MKFSEIVDQAKILLHRTERVSYRMLKREFSLDDEALEDLKEALLFSSTQVRDEDGRGLVWVGDGEGTEPGKRRSGEPATTLGRLH